MTLRRPPAAAAPDRPGRSSPAAHVAAPLLLALALLLPVARGAAQVTTGPLPESSPVGAPYERARALVESGRGEAGRALIDSLLAAAAPGSPAYAEALWWRASLARDAVDAERDLRTLAVEFAASPRALDASLRLAQLELARGRPAEARERLERLRRDQPEGAPRARASYWLARAQLDAGDSRTACTTLNEAAGSALPGDPVARQVVALRRRLPGCELTVAVGSGPGAADSLAAAPAGTPAGTPAAGAPPRATDTTATPVAPNPRDAAPTAATPAPAPAPRAAATGTLWTVQLAAYDRRPDAASMVARLAARGIEARVSGDARPFRVRVGRWPARADAVAAQRELAGKGMAGFVTAAEP